MWLTCALMDNGELLKNFSIGAQRLFCASALKVRAQARGCPVWGTRGCHSRRKFASRANPVAALCLALALLLGASSVRAQQLPVRTYTTADGLPRDLVLRIVRDSHGFLWFCTGDGLSRFNGYEFTNYGVEHGLPHPWITDLIETRQGIYWVATNGGGVCRFNPSPFRNAEFGLRNEQPQIRNLFTVYPVGDESMSNRVEGLYEDHGGQL